jgi:Na+-translocating ferredoxin:NAD+ oxidoreductase RnfD subunit
MDHSLSVQLGAVRIWSAEYDDQIIFAILFYNLFNALLTLQVKRTSRSSNKALCLYQ